MAYTGLNNQRAMRKFRMDGLDRRTIAEGFHPSTECQSRRLCSISFISSCHKHHTHKHRSPSRREAYTKEDKIYYTEHAESKDLRRVFGAERIQSRQCAHGPHRRTDHHPAYSFGHASGFALLGVLPLGQLCWPVFLVFHLAKLVRKAAFSACARRGEGSRRRSITDGGRTGSER